MDDTRLERYSRHILLPQVNVEGQQKLLESRALIIGMGGLGSPVAMYLASSGLGHCVLCDDDQVDLSNLQRQIIHTTADIGQDKVDSAGQTLAALNPDITITTFNRRLQGAELQRQIQLADLVIDASDNFPTRFELNKACVAERTPLISGAVIRMEGQITVFRNDLPDSPCYHCLYHEDDENLTENCRQTGILAPVAGIIGATMATEALKLILNIGDCLCGRLLLLDALNMKWQSLKLARDPLCPVCSSPPGGNSLPLPQAG